MRLVAAHFATQSQSGIPLASAEARKNILADPTKGCGPAESASDWTVHGVSTFDPSDAFTMVKTEAGGVRLDADWNRIQARVEACPDDSAIQEIDEGGLVSCATVGSDGRAGHNDLVGEIPVGADHQLTEPLVLSAGHWLVSAWLGVAAGDLEVGDNIEVHCRLEAGAWDSRSATLYQGNESMLPRDTLSFGIAASFTESHEVGVSCARTPGSGTAVWSNLEIHAVRVSSLTDDLLAAG